MSDVMTLVEAYAKAALRVAVEPMPDFTSDLSRLTAEAEAAWVVVRDAVAALEADLAASVRDWNVVHPARVRGEIEALTADNARLRALIKDVEWEADTHDSATCPWCFVECSVSPYHRDDCPAFTVDGAVR